MIVYTKTYIPLLYLNYASSSSRWIILTELERKYIGHIGQAG